jgi:hypothetical protein
MSAGARILLRLAWLLALTPVTASAHDVGAVQLELRETSAGQFSWRCWAHGEAAPAASELTPRWQEVCTNAGQTLRCGARGLVGRLSIAGVGRTHSLALIRIEWLGGASESYALSAAQPSVAVYGGPGAARSWHAVTQTYLVLGLEHIFGGLDHLAFVLSLLLLVGFQRGQLLLTISAFTLAHSLTLGASVMGWLAVRPAPVEVCIALSIVLVASEALRDSSSLTRRFPALVAFVFGLVHGAGFAGALREAGLPQANVPLALLAFNVGVELGQLATVLVAYVVFRASARVRHAAALRTPALYALGSAAVYWSFARMLALVAP